MTGTGNRLADAAAAQVVAELKAPRGEFGEYRTPARRRQMMRNMHNAYAQQIAQAALANVGQSPFVLATYAALSRELERGRPPA